MTAGSTNRDPRIRQGMYGLLQLDSAELSHNVKIFNVQKISKPNFCHQSYFLTDSNAVFYAQSYLKFPTIQRLRSTNIETKAC